MNNSVKGHHNISKNFATSLCSQNWWELKAIRWCWRMNIYFRNFPYFLTNFAYHKINIISSRWKKLCKCYNYFYGLWHLIILDFVFAFIDVIVFTPLCFSYFLFFVRWAHSTIGDCCCDSFIKKASIIQFNVQRQICYRCKLNLSNHSCKISSWTQCIVLLKWHFT